MSALSALARRYGDRPWFAAVGRAYVPVDRLLGRLSRGRLVALGLRDLHPMLLTTTGRRTGQQRTAPLLYAIDGDAFIIAGSNWGQEHQPAWSANLLAHPDAVMTVAGRSFPVRASLLSGTERDRAWTLLEAVWPAYRTYIARAGERDIRVFRLDRSTAAG